MDLQESSTSRELDLNENTINNVINREIWTMNENAGQFNIKEFENLNSFAARKKYADQTLQKIASGSGRHVYGIDSTKVLKLAANPKGIAQNEVERNMGMNDYYAKDSVAEVFDADKNNLWLVSERAKKITPNRFFQLTGVKIQELAQWLGHMYRSNKPRRFGGYIPANVSPERDAELWENEFAVSIMDLMNTYDLPDGDLGRISSYGEVIRDGQPEVVMTDYGLTHNVWAANYEKPSRWNEGEVNELRDTNMEDELTNFVVGRELYDGGYGGFAIMLQSVGDGLVYEAKIESDIGWFDYDERLAPDQNDLFVSHLEVFDKGQGHFKELMSDIEEFARTHGKKTIVLEPDITQGKEYTKFLNKLYSDYGFVPYENDPSLLIKTLDEGLADSLVGTNKMDLPIGKAFTFGENLNEYTEDYTNIPEKVLNSAISYIENFDNLRGDLNSHISDLYRNYLINVQNYQKGLETANDDVKYYNNLMKLQDFLKRFGLVSEDLEYNFVSDASPESDKYVMEDGTSLYMTQNGSDDELVDEDQTLINKNELDGLMNIISSVFGIISPHSLSNNKKNNKNSKILGDFFNKGDFEYVIGIGEWDGNTSTQEQSYIVKKPDRLDNGQFIRLMKKISDKFEQEAFIVGENKNAFLISKDGSIEELGSIEFNDNEYVGFDFVGTNKEEIDEAGINRLTNHMKGDFAIMSANRNENTLAQNKIANDTLSRELQAKKAGFTPLIGHWEELSTGQQGTVPVREQSFFIPRPEFMTSETFKNWIIDLGKKNKQDAVLIGINGEAALYYMNGNIEKKGKPTFTNIGKAYSQIRRKPDATFVFEERIKSWMPKMTEPVIKKSCMLGGKADGTSEPCSQGDTGAVSYKKLQDGHSHKPNTVNVAEGYISDMTLKIAAEKNMPVVERDGKKFVSVWHGTTPANYKKILKSNKFLAGSYFSTDEKTATTYGNMLMGRGKPVIMNVYIDADKLYWDGNYFSTNQEIEYVNGLYEQENLNEIGEANIEPYRLTVDLVTKEGVEFSFTTNDGGEYVIQTAFNVLPKRYFLNNETLSEPDKSFFYSEMPLNMLVMSVSYTLREYHEKMRDGTPATHKDNVKNRFSKNIPDNYPTLNTGEPLKILSTVALATKAAYKKAAELYGTVNMVSYIPKKDNAEDQRRANINQMFIEKGLQKNGIPVKRTIKDGGIIYYVISDGEINKGVEEGVGDKFLQNRGIMPDEEDEFNKEYYAAQENIITNLKTYPEQKDNFLIKNPKNIYNLQCDVRGVIDSKGNLYVASRSDQKWFTHINLVDALIDEKLLVQQYQWWLKLPENFVTVQRNGCTNEFMVGESNEWYSMSPEKIENRKYFDRFLDLAKKINPKLEFPHKKITELSEMGVEEGVGDKFLQNRGVMPDEEQEFNKQYDILNQENVVADITRYDNIPNYIIKNPKNLKGFKCDVRGIIDNKGNLYVQTNSEDDLLHDNMIEELNHLGVLKSVDEWWKKPPVEFITVHREGCTNQFMVGESQFLYGHDADTSILDKFGLSQEESNLIFHTFLDRAKMINPKLSFPYKKISDYNRKIVSPSMNEEMSSNKESVIQHFINWATKRIGLEVAPEIVFVDGDEYSKEKASLGTFYGDLDKIEVSVHQRLTADILRTLAHELVHKKQQLDNRDMDNSVGSEVENEANAIAAILMKDYAKINKEIFSESINVKNIITEAIKGILKEEKINYGWLMAYFDIPKWDSIIGKIKDEDLYDDGSGTFGKEDEPHITILYGFHKEITADSFKDVIENIKEPIEVELEGISMFENPNFDVVKIDVRPTAEVLKLRKQVETFPATLTYKDYHPHMTIAYVKKGEGKKYVHKFKKPIVVKSDLLVFSDKNKNQTQFPVRQKLLDEGEMNINENPKITQFIEEMRNKPFMKAIMSQGGEVYAVGGIVRDILLGKPNKDIDLVVRLIPFEKLLNILRNFGRANLEGESFSVIKFINKQDGLDYDIGLPRTEQATGGGHKDFDVSSDENLPIEQDLTRRDAKINSMAININTGSFIDPLNGLEDIKNKVMSMTNSQAFIDDPLRMMRMIQFAARFSYDIEPETMKLIQANAGNISKMAKERSLGEIMKIIDKNGDKRKGAQLLKDSKIFKELFGFEPKQSTFDRNPFEAVKTLGEYFYLLTSNAQSPSGLFINTFMTEKSTGSPVYREILALETAFKNVSNNKPKNRLVVNLMAKTAPQTLDSKILPQELQVAVKELKSPKYPLNVGELEINGNDLIAMNIPPKNRGVILNEIIRNIYNDRLNNNREELLNFVKQNSSSLNESEMKNKKRNITYSAVVLDESSRSMLLANLAGNIPNGWEKIAHHMTINMGKIKPEWEKYLGEKVLLKVRTVGYNDKTMAVGVETVVPSVTEIPHITIAINRKNGGKPYDSNKITNWKSIAFGLELTGEVVEVPW